jgi:hypothetical protein
MLFAFEKTRGMAGTARIGLEGLGCVGEEARIGGQMDNQDRVLEQRIRDIVAVATSDIDAIMVEVEDGVAYVEGVMPSSGKRRAMLDAIRHTPGLRRLVSCVSAEHILPGCELSEESEASPAVVVLHLYSLS